MKILVLLLWVFLPACSGKKVLLPREKGVISDSIRVRRPEWPAADPRAIDGEWGYRAKRTVEAGEDCMTPRALFDQAPESKERWNAMVSCLGTLSPGEWRAVYRLDRENPPKLIWDAEENGKTSPPPCWGTDLGRIPVPREMIYWASEESPSPACFTRALELGTDTSLGVRAERFQEQWILSVKAPCDADCARRTLLSWALSPLVKSGPRVPFPDSLCQQCLGEKTIEQLRQAPATREGVWVPGGSP